MKRSLFDIACDMRGGILESRMMARKETEGRPLTDAETISECRYLLDTIGYAGYDRAYTSAIMSACRYVLKKGGKV